MLTIRHSESGKKGIDTNSLLAQNENRYSIMVRPFKRGALRNRLTAHLFDAILHGELSAGERIVEGKIAQQLGVAQSTVREALQQLEHHGLVTKHDNRGTFVSRLTTEDIEGIYTVRRELEPLAASLARERLTAEHLEELANLVEQMRVAGEAGDFVKLLKTDIEFHRLIWKVSGNKWIERALEVVCLPLFGCYLIKTSSGHIYNRAKDLEEHRTLLKVLSEGPPEGVRRVFTQIMETFRVQEIQNFQAAEEAAPTLSDQPVLPAQD